MSRFGDSDGGDDDFNGNGGAMWEKRAELALRGKRGRAALAELREAIVALPEKRLIGRAMCTVGGANRAGRDVEVLEIVDQQGEGVCAIGAYLWHKNVKAGMDPLDAFAALPTVADNDYRAGNETARLGESAGLTFTLAWELAHQNDDAEYGFGDLTPEQRYVAFLGWIDSQLAKPPLTKPPKREPRPRRTVGPPIRGTRVLTGQTALSL